MSTTVRLDAVTSAGRPLVIAGPCSAESDAQVVATARQLAATGRVDVLRAGIWKPRTRPGHYEGPGLAGLGWLESARRETGLPVATEVATAAHVEACLAHGIDVLWIGARTTGNPFSVQEIADALAGSRALVFVKNPVSPDVDLWIGALERLNRAGISRLGAILRGVRSVERAPFHNPPMWELAVELKTRVPGLPVLCDPSHISGTRALIPLVAQKAYDIGLDGLMIESHIDPAAALSDANQQLTPSAVGQLLCTLIERSPTPAPDGGTDAMRALREDIDRLDSEILQRMAARMRVAERIGACKHDSGLTILQVGRWEEVLRARTALALAMGLDAEFTRELFSIVHRESVHVQERAVCRGVPCPGPEAPTPERPAP